MTSAALPVKRVLSACHCVIEEIERNRQMMRGNNCAEWRKQNRWWNFFVNANELYQDILTDDFLIASYRQSDYVTAEKIRDFCKAVLEDGEDMRIEVSDNDFQVLKSHYKKEETE